MYITNAAAVDALDRGDCPPAPQDGMRSKGSAGCWLGWRTCIFRQVQGVKVDLLRPAQTCSDAGSYSETKYCVVIVFLFPLLALLLSTAGAFSQVHQMVDADWHDGEEEQTEAVHDYFKVSFSEEDGNVCVFVVSI